MNNFYRIVSANLAHKKEESPFLKYIENTPVPPPDSLIDEHLLSVFVASFQNNIQGRHLPETGKYPPTNERMLKVPPTLREWKQTSINANMITPHHQPHQPTQHQTLPQTNATPKNEIVVLTFQNQLNNDELSVTIDGNLRY